MCTLMLLRHFLSEVGSLYNKVLYTHVWAYIICASQSPNIVFKLIYQGIPILSNQSDLLNNMSQILMIEHVPFGASI